MNKKLTHKKITTAKAFDVFHPSKIRPQSTSRPVIVANKPEQADPMMKEKEPPGAPVLGQAATQAISSPNEARPTAQPKALAAEQPAQAAEPVSRPTAPIEPLTPANQPQQAPAAPTEAALPSTPTELHEAIDMLAAQNQAAAGRATAPAEAAQSAPASPSEPQTSIIEAAATDPKSDDRPFELPEGTTSAATEAPIISIHHASAGKKFLKWLLVLLLLAALATVAADIALDAGWWTPTYNLPHTNLLQ